MIRRSVSAGVAVAAGLACLAAPLSSQAAVAAYPTAPFEVRYGNTYTVGTVTFYGRSVGAQVSVRSVSSTDCRFVRVESLNSRGHLMYAGAYGDSPVVCQPADRTYPVTAPADVAGGAASVRVNLMAYDLKTGAEKAVNSQRVFP